LVPLFFVVIDEERCVVCRHQLPDFFHRREQLLLIGVQRQNYVFLEILLRMNDNWPRTRPDRRRNGDSLATDVGSFLGHRAFHQKHQRHQRQGHH
jgi:hypothetical protein